MRLLLDTHIFLWYITGDSRLAIELRDVISDSGNEVFLSVVSFWEATIKYQIGKLPLPESPEVYFPTQRHRHDIQNLSLDERSVGKLASLPSHHRDPFDRMLICQALSYDLTIITVDPQIHEYKVPILNL